VAALITMPLSGIAPALYVTVLMLVLRTATGSNLLAIAAAAVLASVNYYAQGGVFGALVGVALTGLSTTCLIRFGLVALVAYFLTTSMLSVLNAALMLNSGAAAVTLLALVGLSIGAAYIAIGSPTLPRAAGSAATL
jgi:hypothetical protein